MLWQPNTCPPLDQAHLHLYIFNAYWIMAKQKKKKTTKNFLFSLVDVVNVYGDKNFLYLVYHKKIQKTHTKYKKKIIRQKNYHKNKNKNTKLKVRDTQFYIFILFLLIYFYDSDTYILFLPPLRYDSLDQHVKETTNGDTNNSSNLKSMQADKLWFFLFVLFLSILPFYISIVSRSRHISQLAFLLFCFFMSIVRLLGAFNSPATAREHSFELHNRVDSMLTVLICLLPSPLFASLFSVKSKFRMTQL